VANFADTLFALLQQQKATTLDEDRRMLRELPSMAGKAVIDHLASEKERAQLMGQLGMQAPQEEWGWSPAMDDWLNIGAVQAAQQQEAARAAAAQQQLLAQIQGQYRVAAEVAPEEIRTAGKIPLEQEKQLGSIALQEMRGENAIDVANIYANSRKAVANKRGSGRGRPAISYTADQLLKQQGKIQDRIKLIESTTPSFRRTPDVNAELDSLKEQLDVVQNAFQFVVTGQEIPPEVQNALQLQGAESVKKAVGATPAQPAQPRSRLDDLTGKAFPR